MTHGQLTQRVAHRWAGRTGVLVLVHPVTSAAMSALLAATAMRPWGFGLLAFVAYVPAFNAIASARTPRTGALVAAVASLGAASVGYEATAAIGPHFYALALILAPLPYAAVGLVAATFASTMRSPRGVRAGTASASRARARSVATRRPSLRVVAVLPVLWCAAEWLPAQPWLWGGVAMPLGAIGYSQADLPTLGLAALSSVTAVSAAVLAVNALLLFACSGRSAALRLAAVTGLMAVATVVAVTSQADETPSDAAPGHPADAGALIRLVQPNLPDSAYLAAAELPAANRALTERLAALTMAEHHDDAPALTIMPEAAWPGPIALDAPDASSAAHTLAALGLPQPVLFGAPSTGTDAGAGIAVIPRAPTTADGPAWYANSAFLLDDGQLSRVQDKLHLVPVAERGLRRGTQPAVFEAGGVPLSVLICYDAVFPGTVRAAARAGAEMLVVLTDDSFAARGDVPELHLRVAVFRAVETGLPLALAANTGPSALIAANGRVVARTSPLVATSLTAMLPLARRTTLFVRFGDWLGPLATLLGLVVAAFAVSKGGGAGSFGSRPT